MVIMEIQQHLPVKFVMVHAKHVMEEPVLIVYLVLNLDISE